MADRVCRFCSADISGFHPRRKVCLAPECQKKQEEALREARRIAGAKWREEHPSRWRVYQADKKSQNTKNGKRKRKRRCRYCGNVLKGKNMFFCDDHCARLYAGDERYDGEWMFA